MEIELKFRNFLEHYSKHLTALIRKIDRSEQLTSELISLTSYLPDSVTTSQRLYHFKFNIPQIITCKSCHRNLIYKGFTLGYRTYCNSTCANKDPEFLKRREETNLRNSGVRYSSQSKKAKETAAVTRKNKTVEEKQAIQVKRKQTNLLIYGKEHPLQTEEIMDKQRQTNMLRRGVPYSMQSQEGKDNYKQYFMDTYGVPNASCLPEVKKKKEETFLKNYGHKCSLQDENVKEKIKSSRNIIYFHKLLSSDRLKNLVVPLFTAEEYNGREWAKKYLFRCVACNKEFKDNLYAGNIPRCMNCFPSMYGKSKYDVELFEWLTSLQITNILKNNRSLIAPKEVDIYLPDYKLAIEFNGLWTHSEKKGKTKTYHLNKTNLCKNKDVSLIHIFEDEWIEKQEIVKSHIKDNLGIFDRSILVNSCIVKEISKKDTYDFLFENHFQKPHITKYNYGLYYEEELVSTVSLNNSRYNKNYDYELLRSCCKINTQVLGGFDKLIKYVAKSLNSASIISYVDKRYFNGSGYKNWNYIGDTEPNYFYTKDYKVRESRLKYQKHKIDNASSELTKWENMQLAGYDRIWDCGSMIFTLCL